MAALDLAKSPRGQFAIVDPVGTIHLFLAATPGLPDEQRKLAARIAAVTVFVVLAHPSFWGIRCWFFPVSISPHLPSPVACCFCCSRDSWVGADHPAAPDPRGSQVGCGERHGRRRFAGHAATCRTGCDHPTSSSPQMQRLAVSCFRPRCSFRLQCVSVWLSFRLAPAIALKLSASDTHVVTRLIGPIIAAVSIDMIAADSASCFQNC